VKVMLASPAATRPADAIVLAIVPCAAAGALLPAGVNNSAGDALFRQFCVRLGRFVFNLMRLMESYMTFIGWIVLGLIAGFIASKIFEGSGQGVVVDIILGIVGAFVGGFLFSFIGASPVTGFNLYSMFVAIVGAVVVLWIYHALSGRRAIR